MNTQIYVVVSMPGAGLLKIHYCLSTPKNEIQMQSVQEIMRMKE